MIQHFFHEFWTTPLPQFIVDKIGILLRPIGNKLTERKLDPATYLKLSLLLTIIALVGVIVLSGTFNPLDLLFDIPYLSADEYVVTIANRTSYTWAEYFAFSGIFAMIVLGLINIFIFKGENYKITTVQGIVYTIMAILIAMICDMLCQDAFKIFHELYITDDLRNPMTFAAALLANLTIFFVLDGALESSLSFSITPYIAKSLKVNMFDLGLIHFIAVALVFKLVVMIIDKIGIWKLIINFIYKWCYTPKYILTIVFYFYFFIPILVLRIALPDVYRSLKTKFNKKTT